MITRPRTSRNERNLKRGQLRKRSPVSPAQVVVPPLLSEKRWAANASRDFVRERAEALTRFANRLAAHPKLYGTLEAVLESITGRRPALDIFKPLYLAQIELDFHDS